MKQNGFSHIRRWLWVFMLLVGITLIVTFCLVFNEITGTLASVPVIISATDKSTPIDVTSLVTELKGRILLILGIGAAAACLLSILWLQMATRAIHRPIRMIQRAVTRMAQGKLNETITIDTADEFGQIGAGVNELAANLQELLLHIWKQTGQCVGSLESLQQGLIACDGHAPTPEAKEALDQLTLAIDDLRAMAKAYVFYEVRLEGDQTLAADHYPFQGTTPLPTETSNGR
ncbi:MAG: HAMP domain-containing protein [Desulfatitalea sp.]|nr:HAMP domain-containing protein [Desulfatitalea sp.]